MCVGSFIDRSITLWRLDIPFPVPTLSVIAASKDQMALLIIFVMDRMVLVSQVMNPTWPLLLAPTLKRVFQMSKTTNCCSEYFFPSLPTTSHVINSLPSRAATVTRTLAVAPISPLPNIEPPQFDDAVSSDSPLSFHDRSQDSNHNQSYVSPVTGTDDQEHQVEAGPPFLDAPNADPNPLAWQPEDEQVQFDQVPQPRHGREYHPHLNGTSSTRCDPILIKAYTSDRCNLPPLW